MRGARYLFPPMMALLGCRSPAPSDAAQSAPETMAAASTPAPPPAAPVLQGPALYATVRNGDDLSPMPSRIIITASQGTMQPPFHSDPGTAGDISPEAIAVTDGVFLVHGQGLVPLPPGSYDLTFMQGPEYDWQQRHVTIGDKDVVSVDVTLEHSVHTPGWLAADMHLHSIVSFDSKVMVRHRVVSEVTAGISVLVPTEHALHYDMEPEIRELAYDQLAVSVPGSEYGFSAGHIGVYPVTYEPEGALLGAPGWERWPWTGLDPETYFPLIHALPENPVIIINHPRLLPDLGYFSNIGWPQTPGQDLSTANLFDGMEVLNGYENEPSQTMTLLRDWFSLLGNGHRVAGLANSDSHTIAGLRAGYPRTWLHLPTEVPAQVLPSDVRGAVLGMHAVGSNGPFLWMTVDGYDLGDTVPVSGGQVQVHIEADAPQWIQLNQVQLYLSGELVRALPITSQGHPVLQADLTLNVAKDGWLVAMAVGDEPLSQEAVGTIWGGLTRPFAFTNPVWLDADGDGAVTPTGGLVPQPQPFGQMAPAPDQVQGTGSNLLHVPLDCNPDNYYLWRGKVLK